MKKTVSDVGAPDLATPFAGSFDRADYGIAALAAAGALSVYWRTLGPVIFGEDAGELTTAAWCLGVPHPPGYPTWTLLAHLFAWLPIGTVAWRVAFMSAFFGAATVALVALLILWLTRNRWAALTGALALAWSGEFWSQSVIPEVYTLDTFCIALSVLLLWRWRASRNDRLLYAFALFYGVSTGAHNTMMLLGPLFALFIIGFDENSFRRWPVYAGMATLAAIGALVYLYLPWRARMHPVMNWGDPETFSKFWFVFTRKQYLWMAAEHPRSIVRFLRQMAIVLDFGVWQFAPWGGLLGLYGLVVLFRRRWTDALFLSVLGLGVTVVCVYAQNFQFEKEWIWVMTVFNLPLYLVVALGIGVAIDALSRKCDPWRIVAPIALFCVLSPLLLHWRENDKSHYYWADDYARNVLNQMEPNAIYIPEVDHGSFPETYLQAVEGLRPDIWIARKCGYLDPGLVKTMPEAERDGIPEIPRLRDETRIFTWLVTHESRPVYFAVPPKLPDAPDIAFQQAGLLYRVVRPGETPSATNDWAGYRWHTLDPADTRGDNTAELIWVEVMIALGKQNALAGDPENAVKLFDQAIALYGPDATMLDNLATWCWSNGLKGPVRRYLVAALQADPDEETVRKNLEKLDKIEEMSGAKGP